MTGVWLTAPTGGPSSRLEENAGIGWSEVLRIWLRALWVIVPVAVLGAALALAVSFTMEPVYETQAVILLDRESAGDLGNAADAPKTSPVEREAIVRSQMELVRADPIVGGVIDELHLGDQPMFNPPPGLVSEWLPKITAYLGLPAPAHETPLPGAERERLIRAYLEHLVIIQDADTYILHIGFRAPDPALAARIANKHVAHYVNWLRDQQALAINGSQAWLVFAVAASRARLSTAEQAMQDFNKSGVMFNVEGRTSLDQGLAQLTSDLAVAQANMVKTKARADEMIRLQKAGQDGSIAAMADSKLLADLEAAYAQSSADSAAGQTRYGTNFPGALQSRARDGGLRTSINREIARVVDGAVSQAAVARSTVDNLTAALDHMKQQVVNAETGRSRLQRLEGETDTERRIYLSLLEKLRSYDTVSDLSKAKVTMVSPAQVPDVPRSPRRVLFAAFGFMFAAAAASGAVVWRSQRRDLIRDTTDASLLTGLNCLGVMPVLKLRRRSRQIDRRHAGYSFFREELRSICAALARDNAGDRSKGMSVLVTSSLPREGKSTFCYELGRFAAESGARTLLVRADLSRGSYPRGTGASGPVLLEEDMELFGLDWLVPPILFGQPEFAQLLDRWQREFALVVIDTPPLSAMAESVILAPMVRASIVLARVDRTPRSLLASVTAQIEKAGGHIAGLVVTFAQLDGHRGMAPSDFGYYFHENRAYHKRLSTTRAPERV